MTEDSQWTGLIDYVNEWAVARETPEGIEVLLDETSGGARRVVVVVDAAGWAEYSGVIWGVDDPAHTDIRRLVTSVRADQPYLVYDEEQWATSATPELPPDPDDSFTPEPGGEWVAPDREGNVTSRYRDWMDPPSGATTPPP